MANEGATAELTGITGLGADVIGALGEVGVGAMTLLETVIPPVPSEVILPLAGFLAQQGELSVVWVLVLATLGSVAGAWIFYGLGAVLGLDRAISLLDRVPLLDAEDLRSASDWFQQHGRASVFFGRLVPGVRSLISLPAGAQKMPLLTFSVWTALGSAIWNSALVAAGYAVGSQWETVGGYVSTISNVVLIGLLVVGLTLLIRRSFRRNRLRREHAS
ncbi:DedA family protein [Kineosporia mesophila]|nr:DedA family protein [Kineosporia mesophila]MCD5353669.1 DedA family protein [Kineosporia mesophila]